MRRIIIFSFCCLFLCSPAAFGHPPRNLESFYSPEEKTLSLKMVHVTNNRNDHFIRKVELHRADGSVQKKIYYRQKYLKNIEKAIPVELNEGETIQIKAFCKKGGVLKESFTAPEAEKDEDDQ